MLHGMQTFVNTIATMVRDPGKHIKYFALRIWQPESFLFLLDMGMGQNLGASFSLNVLEASQPST